MNILERVRPDPGKLSSTTIGQAAQADASWVEIFRV